MDVKQLIRKLADFDASAVVTVGDYGGWSNIESVIEDGACVKIVISDNVIFSDDRPAEEHGVAALQTANSTKFAMPVERSTVNE